MSLLRASFTVSLLVSGFVACSPGKGAELDDGSGGGGTSNAGSAGSLPTGGTNVAGAAPSGGTSGAGPSGGVSGTGLAGSGPTGGVSGSAGAATGGAAGMGGDITGGVGGSVSGAAGSGGDAGSPPGGTGGSGPYPGTVIIEDDFDAAAMIDAKWTRFPSFNGASPPVIDTTRTHSPPNAVLATGSSIGSFIRPTSGQLGGMIATGNRFYVRVFANFENATSAIMGHVAFLVGATAESNGTELRLGMSNNQSGKPQMVDLNLIGTGAETTRYSNGFTDGGNAANFPNTGLLFEANRWYCIEALYDGAASEFRLWINDTEIMEMHVHDFSGNNMPRTDWGPMFTFLKIGAQNYSGTIGRVWYDDVFAGSAQIGCAR